MKVISLILLGLVVLIVVWYAAYGREWLKAKPWAAGFFAAVEPLEIMLYKKSETILFARLKMVTGLLLTALTMLGGIDLTPIMPFVPDQYHGTVRAIINLLPMAITLVGMMDERLRNTTTKPLELVAIPEAQPMSPQVAIAVADAELAKETAVAVVKQQEQPNA
jgi:hypothetical protein